jgi:chromosome segregation ATPase
MSGKRPRALTDGLDPNGSGSHNRVCWMPRSQQTHANIVQSKRPRQSDTEDSDRSSDDERSKAASGSESSDDEGEHTREREYRATQQVQKEHRATANRENVATDSGIIEEIQCINFMCHEHLTVTLGPLINFIIGHNGSGKSAVLTALTICLGGKATATNRAQNLKSLIKEGKDHASVTVKIKNQGPLAYKPAQYGDSIIVERHFSRSGTSGFKLKNVNNKLVTNKKAELEDILDAFSMQIDNPMNVLTQDMARQFLNHSTPKDKYKFFLQGTQLENLNRDYQQIEQSLEVMNTKAEVKEADLTTLRREMEMLERKARRAASIQTMRAKEAEYNRQAAWATVREQEKEVAHNEAELERTEAIIQTRQRAVEQAGQDYERADSAHEAAKQSVAEITTAIEPAEQMAHDAKAKFDEVRAKLQQVHTDARNAATEFKAKKTKVQKLEEEIAQYRQRQAEADNGRHAEKIRERDEAKVQLENARAACEGHDTGLAALQEQLETAQNEQKEADRKVDNARNNVASIRASITKMQSGQSNWDDGYPNPRGLSQLLNAINSERRFREKPVGPLGRHVKLQKPKWGRILEKQFGQTLNGFVVTSKQDQSILSGLMNRIGWYVGLLTSLTKLIMAGLLQYILARGRPSTPMVMSPQKVLPPG